MAYPSLALAVSNAVTFLTRNLVASYPSPTIAKLQFVLEANLTAHCTTSWVESAPLSGSGRRCLTLSPDCLPPRTIYAACIASGVQWFDWMHLLDIGEFDLFIDPGCVSLRCAQGPGANQLLTIWADEILSPVPTQAYFKTPSIQAVAQRRADYCAKTFAQQVIERESGEDEEILSMIHHEVHAPWSRSAFPLRSPSPLSTISSGSTVSTHSRCSSRSSNSSGSASTGSASIGKPKLSRRERARQARIYVDTSKTEVTPYDGGKTTVLTGGVMLGGGMKKAVKSAAQAAASWRA